MPISSTPLTIADYAMQSNDPAIQKITLSILDNGSILDDLPLVTDYLGRVANQAEGFADYLKKTSFGEVVGDLEKLARRQPFLFVGSALVVGLLGGRFLKSSPPERTAASHDAIAGGVEGAR